MKCIKTIILIILFSNTVLSQSNLKLPKTREVIVTEGDSMVRAHVLYQDQKKVRPSKNSTYHWYHSNSIKTNTGAYFGKLLYGEYIVFDDLNNMIKRGKMHAGKKKGEWLTWYDNGNLKRELNWKKGRLHGKFKHYNRNGELLEEGRYKRGELQENKKEYSGKKDVNKVKYMPLKEVKTKKSKKRDQEKKSWQLFQKKSNETSEEKGDIKKQERLNRKTNRKKDQPASKNNEADESKWWKKLFNNKKDKDNA